MKPPPSQIDAIAPYFNSDAYLSDTFESIWCDLGNICSNYGLSKLAVFCFDNALKHKRKGFRNLYRIAREFIFISNFEKVSEIIGRLTEIDSSQFYIEVLTGHLLLSRNKLKESHVHFVRAIASGPADFLLLFGIAKWNEATKKHSEALKYYSILMKSYASHVFAHKSKFRIMSICKLENNLNYAKRFLLALENVENGMIIEKEAININLASCYELENDDEAAIKICESIILTKPNFPFSYKLMAWIYFKLNNFHASLECLEAGLAVMPNDPYFFFLKGKIFFNQKKYDKAQSMLAKASELGPYDPFIWNSYGIVAHKLKLYDQAEICFKTALKIEKNFSAAKFNLVLVHRILKRVTDAKKLMDELIMANRNDVELVSLSRNLGVDLIFYDTDCRDVNINVGLSIYFASEVFFGGSPSYVDFSDYLGMDLDPLTEAE